MKPDTVTVPRWAAEMVAEPWNAPECGVCIGLSPSWDGHNVNPPCIGYAREVIFEALDE